MENASQIKSNAAVGVFRRTVQRGRGRRQGEVQDGAEVASMENEENLPALPEPVVEQPEGAPPLSELSADSLALVVDGPSLVSAVVIMYMSALKLIIVGWVSIILSFQVHTS